MKRIGMAVKFLSCPVSLVALAIAAATLLAIPQAHAANIITFGNTAQACGGAVMCSPSGGTLPQGTQGYTNNGTGVAFNLSTITQWFQINPDGISHLPNQPAEPDGGAGGFRVVNDTGAVVTTFSLTLTDTFTKTTPSVHPCTGAQAGDPVGCDNFSGQKGTAFLNTSVTLSGPKFDSCTTGTQVGSTCTTTASNAAADFAPNSITYTWTGPTNIPIGAFFDITFASWNNDSFTTPVPEPVTMFLGGTGLLLLGYGARRRLFGR